ncbi:MAG: Fe-S cluster assembly protein IscX [Bacteroidales bacterium]|nr:Fe-S cluster assembly protein IscX [Bacteroidales bacterium]
MKWNDYTTIAESLEESFSDVDLMQISDEDLVRLVNSLSAFSEKGAPPPEDVLGAIMTVWIQLKDNLEGDDSRWDAYV